MTKKSKLVLALASMLGVSAGATAVSGFAWFTTTKQATVSVTNIGIYSKSSGLDVAYLNNVKNTEGGTLTDGTLTVKAKSTANVVETFSGNASEKSFTLRLTPYTDTDPVITVGGEANTGWSIAGKTITFTTAPASGTDNIQVTYHPREVLTDVSSIDGQHIYKPTWTASGEGQFATAMPAATDGYLSFTLRLTASGASDLEVFLNSPSIVAATSADADEAAADIARVAIIEDTTTKLVLQNDVSANDQGISSTNAATPNWECDSTHEGLDGWDLSKSGATTTVPDTTFAQTGSASKNNLSSAPAHGTDAQKVASNYVTHIDAGDHKDITVAVWLEGTSYNKDGHVYGAYDPDTNPLNGLFTVNLPLIAF